MIFPRTALRFLPFTRLLQSGVKLCQRRRGLFVAHVASLSPLSRSHAKAARPYGQGTTLSSRKTLNTSA
ncbi:protein of unknown function [Azospirillum baldaniorum]|uniref:Uncharacterized protein n=1 Tax=Azospirillum baldaniorum TaxID=1064539 RepID=A0A9P1NLG5_9PROT|nr:protein of unknown function [Azospirillum baldaniorum]